MVPAIEVVRADVEPASIEATAAVRGENAVRSVRVKTVGVVTETSNLLREKIGELKCSAERSVRGFQEISPLSDRLPTRDIVLGAAPNRCNSRAPPRCLEERKTRHASRQKTRSVRLPLFRRQS